MIRDMIRIRANKHTYQTLRFDLLAAFGARMFLAVDELNAHKEKSDVD